MKVNQRGLYVFWIISSFIISAFLMINLYPDYSISNEFPLFTDLTLILFLPAFFIFSYLLIHFSSTLLENSEVISENIIILIQAFLIFLTFIISLNFMVFSLAIRVMISIFFLIISSPHFIITKILYRKSNNQI